MAVRTFDPQGPVAHDIRVRPGAVAGAAVQGGMGRVERKARVAVMVEGELAEAHAALVATGALGDALARELRSVGIVVAVGAARS